MVIDSMEKILQAYVSQKYTIEELRQIMINHLIKISRAKYVYLSICVYNEAGEMLYQQLTSISPSIKEDSQEELLTEFPLDNLNVYKFKFIDKSQAYNQTIMTKKPYYSNTVKERLGNNKHCPFFPKGNVMDNYLNYPLMYADNLIGTMGLACREGGFNEDIIKTLEPLINTITCIEIAHKKDREINTILNSKSKFLGNMSHELRTPMNAILGVLQLLESENLTSKAKQYINMAKDASSSMLRLINDILDLCSIEEGKMKFNPENFNLSKEVYKVVKTIEQNSKKNLSFIFQYNPNIPTKVYTDKGRIKQIFTNLLNNAEKFTSKGMIICKIDYESSKFFIEIKDTGRGIDFTKMNKNILFGRFVREDETTRTTTTGTGLGLSIVKSIVDMMKGEIDVESKVDEGTTFYIKIPIPLSEEKNKKEKEKEIKKEDKYYPFNILLVEDNIINQEIIKAMLTRLGCIITITNNGQEGVDKWKEIREKTDIVFMDCHMPVKDGYTATKEIRQYEKNNKLKPCYIVGITASVISGREKCIKVGMSDFIEKPIIRNKLLSILDTYEVIKDKLT